MCSTNDRGYSIRDYFSRFGFEECSAGQLGQAVELREDVVMILNILAEERGMEVVFRAGEMGTMHNGCRIEVIVGKKLVTDQLWQGVEELREIEELIDTMDQ